MITFSKPLKSHSRESDKQNDRYNWIESIHLCRTARLILRSLWQVSHDHVEVLGEDHEDHRDDHRRDEEPDRETCGYR